MYEWRDYRYVTPKYMKDFAVKPPCNRPPLAEGQVAHPTSIKRGEEFPKEWAKRQAKLQKQTQKAVEEFNRATKASAEAGASGSASAPKKAMQKKPANKPKPSVPKPSVAQPAASKATSPQISKSSVPPPASSSLMAAARDSTPIVLASCQRTEGFPIASIAASSASASGQPSSMPKLKQKVTAGRGTRPSPKSKAVVPQVDEHGLADEDELAEFLRRKQ
jgi:hypothetical protein